MRGVKDMSSKTLNFDGFVGEFKTLLTQFVKMKQSLGFSYVAPAEALQGFSKFTLNYSIKDHALTKELVDAWIEKRAHERDVTWPSRINNLKQFALFLNNLGYDAYIPVCKAKINRNLHLPYIFTFEELQCFFSESEKIKSHPLSLQHIVFPAVYRMLYGCGLRVSEVLALKLRM